VAGDRIQHILFAWYSSQPELLSLTQLGAFAIGDKPKGMPKPIKFILDKFSQGREKTELVI